MPSLWASRISPARPWAILLQPKAALPPKPSRNNCPVRTLHIDHLDEQSLGELLMQFMLETIIAAHLLGVDPFDQPAVEEGKVLAKQYLSGER
ncbi:MAG TPA: hypothetical protein VK148_06130 [Xanthobacteraceae bacterium]|nr:hypothetical protein [Xanthobacteraceae bacterium]